MFEGNFLAVICYHGEIPYKINPDRVDIILKVMLDLHKRNLLFCIKNESKTIQQISQEIGLSISSVYRRICDLDEKKLLILSGKFNFQGKKEFRYKSKIRKVIIVFEKDVIDLTVYSNLRK